MVKAYDMEWNGQINGVAHIERKGLYYHITCRCDLPSSEMYRVKVFGQNAEIDLGVCIPMGSHFGIETHLPVSRLGEGEMSFQIISQNKNVNNRYIPVETEKPFAYISLLRNGSLRYQNGVPCILIPE